MEKKLGSMCFIGFVANGFTRLIITSWRTPELQAEHSPINQCTCKKIYSINKKYSSPIRDHKVTTHKL